MSTISPAEGALAALRGHPSEGPVVMLNLLKFRRGGGSRAYARYSDAFGAVLTAHGGRFLYLGRAAERLVGNEEWDAVALVEYPSRQVFLKIVESPEYAAVAALREDGLERTVLYATDPRPAAVVITESEFAQMDSPDKPVSGRKKMTSMELFLSDQPGGTLDAAGLERRIRDERDSWNER